MPSANEILAIDYLSELVNRAFPSEQGQRDAAQIKNLLMIGGLAALGQYLIEQRKRLSNLGFVNTYFKNEGLHLKAPSDEEVAIDYLEGLVAMNHEERDNIKTALHNGGLEALGTQIAKVKKDTQDMLNLPIKLGFYL